MEIYMECKKMFVCQFSIQMNLLISPCQLYWNFVFIFLLLFLYIPLTVNFLMVSCFYRHILFPAVQEMAPLQ